jgi:hypothetical protein
LRDKPVIISHKYKFIFIKTRKTAGTSIEISLSRYCGEQDILTPLSPEDEAVRRQLNIFPRNYCVPFSNYDPKDFWRLLRGHRLRYYNHIPARRIKKFLGEEKWNSYFKFCFERNPWDKVLSYYHYRMPKKQYASLDDFFAQSDLCGDFEKYAIDGSIAVDFIGRYENLESDLGYVCEKLSIPFDGWMPRAKASFRKDSRRHAEILNEEQKRIINESFKREIEAFAYEF